MEEWYDLNAWSGIAWPHISSGAPIDRDPTADNLADAADETKINNFNYTDDLTTGVRCPFTAHLRKTNPRRSSFPGVANVQPRRIMRHGIPYGHEVTQAENAAGVTHNDRGLLFVRSTASN